VLGSGVGRNAARRAGNSKGSVMATTTITDASDLGAKLAAAAPGDTILLSGNFGDVRLQDIRPEKTVRIAAAAPGAAHFERLVLGACSGLSFSGINFWPLSDVPPSKKNEYLVVAYPDCSNIEFAQSVFRGRPDSDNHPTWDVSEWNRAKIGAAFLRGDKCVVRNCAAVGVQFGFGVAGANSEVFGNRIFGFSGDGIRVTNDNCVVIGNRVTDAMQIDGNHSDGFQAFKVKSLLNGMVVKDNVFLEWTARPDNPLRTKMQGIGFHNGPYANIVIRDNSVETTSPNGMNLNAIENVTVTGNRVRNANGRDPKLPWIRMQNCSGEIVVENNEAESFKLQHGVVSRLGRKPDYRVKY
jgi:hypothetical protein